MQAAGEGRGWLPRPGRIMVAGENEEVAMNGVTEITPRPAATVLLLRDGPTGLEVLMVTRNVASDCI